MKRGFVSYADVLSRYKRNYEIEFNIKILSSGEGYGVLKKAFPEVIRAMEEKYPGCIADNGKKGKGRAYKYIGVDDNPLAEERQATEQKSLEDYVTFCKASSGIMPSSWFSSFFENTQLLLDTNRESKDGTASISSSLEQNLTNIHLLPTFYKAITDKQVLKFFYQRFGQEPFEFTFHPQFLKEYNGRWFVFGDADREPYKAYNVPLDRIETLPYGEHDGQWYGEIQLTIEPNRELRGKILAYGQYLEVITPQSLREQIKDNIREQMEQYLDDK